MKKWSTIFGLLLAFLGVHLILFKSVLGTSSSKFSLLESSLNQYTIEDIVTGELSWNHTPKPIILTHEKKDIWIQLNLEAQNNPDWVFEIPFGWVHSFEVYSVENNEIKAWPSADAYIVYQRANFTRSKGLDTVLYIKIPTIGLNMLTPVALPKANQLRWNFYIVSAIGLFLGAMIILILSSLIMYASSKDSVYLWYALFQTSTLLFQAVLEGGFFVLYPEQRSNYPVSSALLWGCMALCNLTGIKFVFSQVKKHSFAKLAHKIVSIILVLYILSFSFMLFMPSTLKSLPILFTNSLTSLLTIYGMVHLIRKQAADQFFIAGWLGLGISMLGAYFAFAGLLVNSWISVRIHSMGILWEALLLYFSIGQKIKTARIEKSVIRSVLTGKTSQTELNRIFEQPFRKMATTVREITVMFVDIVGYSRLDDSSNSIEIFDQLSARLVEVGQIIKQHGGNIDRSVGDGIICFFGYSSSDIPGSARQAFEAAREIQRISILRADDPEKLMLPLRIGINTDKVVVGNLGSSDRVDFTMIGRGVNIASRLENACNPFCIMVSTLTHQKLELDNELENAMRPIHIKVKHSDSFMLAYEFNEFHKEGALLRKAENAHNQQLNISKKHERFSADKSTIILESAIGDLEVLDFSISGLGVGSLVFFGSKTEFEVAIRFQDKKLEERLRTQLLTTITVKTRWSQAGGESYRAGLEYVGLNDEQRGLLFDCFTKAT